jgi:hypothetical protein
MPSPALLTIRERLTAEPDLRERLLGAFGRTLAAEGYLAVLSIEDIASLYAWVADPASSPDPHEPRRHSGT